MFGKIQNKKTTAYVNTVVGLNVRKRYSNILDGVILDFWPMVFFLLNRTYENVPIESNRPATAPTFR